MTPHRKDHQLDRMIGIIENLTTLRPAAHDHLDRELRILDGFATPNTEPRVSGGHTEWTPTEATGNARVKLDADRHYLDGLIDAAELGLRTALTEANRIIGRRTPGLVIDSSVEPKPRCDGGVGREGALEWGRPDCTNVPGVGAICLACYHRERRWRIIHDLPTRETA